MTFHNNERDKELRLMLHFNNLLADIGISPKEVRLVRHQDTRLPMSPFALWLARNGEFEYYQSFQSKDRFKNKYVSSFVATPNNETLFVGLYEKKGKDKVPPGEIWRLDGSDIGDCFRYDLSLCDELSEFVGRIVIDWGPGYRSWVQKAEGKKKAILEIRKEFSEPNFPGFSKFRKLLSELATVPHSWKMVLSSVNGIYLMVSEKTGEQYVGSAYGADGIWGRWESYIASGHGGNIGMKAVGPTDYIVSVLEVAASSATLDEIIEMESRWKDKLLTRKFGLNEN